MSTPWATEIRATSAQDPSQLVRSLAGAVLGCGGWVLSRSLNDTGTLTLLFEFERQATVNIYSMLVASGIELSQAGHIWFTDLCHCTMANPKDCSTEIASIDLEIQTRLAATVTPMQAPTRV